MSTLPLAQVTLCAVDCDTPALSALALHRAQRGIAFGRVLLFTRSWLPTVVLPRLEVVDIEPLYGAAGVADFVARRLHAYVSSSHAMLMRWDAGVLDPAAWSDEFLVPDYLAAPAWPGDETELPGLSLRSRRWLRAGTDPRLSEPQLDDNRLCGARRVFLEDVHGVHFAAEALSRRFAGVDGVLQRRTQGSVEPAPFGFVGAAYLPAVLGEGETLELVQRLPRGFAARPGAAAFEAALQALGMHTAVQALQRLPGPRAATPST
jgi:hypothetical protein